MKNNAASPPKLSGDKTVRYLALGWLACVILLLAVLFYLLPRSQINSSVMALLPKETVSGIADDLLEEFNKRLDRQLVWLISPGDSDNTAPVNWWLEQLSAMPEIADVNGQIDERQQEQWAQFFYDYRYALLDDASRQRIEQGAESQSQWILSQIYSPFAGVSAQELENDPLLLMRSARQTQQNASGSLQLYNGWLTTLDEQGRRWYLIRGELKGSSYHINDARLTVKQLEQFKLDLLKKWPDTQLLQRGTLYYSDYASQQAQRDISTIGVISALGIILLMWLVFHSLKPLLLTLLSLAIGITSGTVITLFVFSEVHIMTLVMSTSVIGISVDYALHYLTERMIHGEQESALASLNKLLPVLTLAVFSSSVAYLILLLAPFPGLRQLAVFAASGLTGAFLTVVCWYPLLANKLPVRSADRFSWTQRWLNLWRFSRWVRLGLPLTLLTVGIAGILLVKTDDDISKLQTLPAYLQQQEQSIARLTGQSGDQKWLMVYGDSAEQTLQRLERLKPTLNELKQDGAFTDYQLLPLHSIDRQQRNIALVKSQIAAIIERLNQAGLSLAVPNVADKTLTPEHWLSSDVSDGWRLLWLTNSNGKSAALVPVSGVNHPQSLRQLELTVPGIYWIDKRAQFSELFSVYRYYLSWLLAAAVLAISLLFIIKFRWPRAIYCIIPMALSLIVGLGMLGLTGQTLNLFSLLALVLVLGIGIDYTLFFSNPRGKASTSMLAIFMAALTTQLTFGLLALSHTQAIAGFGTVLIGGILTAFLLSPLALPGQKGRPDDRLYDKQI